MTTSRNGGPSRPSSSRATSVVGDIRKRREKPYKTETKKILRKKNALTLKTSYTKPPNGYTFVPLGTPDLSDRCKELSRQRQAAVYVVNAKPANKYQQDPQKISHHIHRIGLHFRSDIVDEAREELGYIFHSGHFVREDDLQQRNHQKLVSNVMARWGYSWNQTASEESPDRVRNAIKELFPKIPEEDLNQIVTHAWEKGTHRVGTNAMLELSRRVQLATIARIRHRYTDYDVLLRAFQWREARNLVEKDCLNKLIEWRGENDGDSNEQEEVLREIIVIDDDDDENTVADGSEADDEDSSDALVENSDIEVTHQLAGDEDLGAESVDERSRSFLQQYHPAPFWRTQQRNENVRQKIGEVRQEMRNALPQPAILTPVYVPADRNGATADTFVVDGQVYHRAPPPPQNHPPAYQYPNPQYGSYNTQYGAPSNSHQSPFVISQPSSIERVLPSIEPREPSSGYERSPYHTQPRLPVTAERDYRPDKRQRVGYSPNHLQPYGQLAYGGGGNYSHAQQQQLLQQPPPPSPPPPPPREIIDLTSPDRSFEPVHGAPHPAQYVKYENRQ